jgi:hypothetical protein
VHDGIGVQQQHIGPGAKIQAAIDGLYKTEILRVIQQRDIWLAIIACQHGRHIGIWRTVIDDDELVGFRGAMRQDRVNAGLRDIDAAIDRDDDRQAPRRGIARLVGC